MAWVLAGHVVNELNSWDAPDRLPILNGILGGFFSRFDIFKLYCGSLLLRVSVDSHNLTKLVEEGVNGHIVVFLGRHVLDIDGVTSRIYYALLLLRLAPPGVDGLAPPLGVPPMPIAAEFCERFEP